MSDLQQVRIICIFPPEAFGNQHGFLFSFCRDTCYAIGRINGTCNEDNTDCDCHSESVSPKQYALCIEDGICRYFCQQKGYGTGDCAGKTGWDCQCVSKKEGGEGTLRHRKHIYSVINIDSIIFAEEIVLAANEIDDSVEFIEAKKEKLRKEEDKKEKEKKEEE